MHLVNLTPHDVVIMGQTPHDAPEYDELVRIPKSPAPARVVMTESPVGEVAGISVFQAKIGKTTGLPKPNGNGYIVSRVVAEANPTRRDLYIPHHTVRDSEGRIIGCQSLAQVTASDGVDKALVRIMMGAAPDQCPEDIHPDTYHRGWAAYAEIMEQ